MISVTVRGRSIARGVGGDTKHAHNFLESRDIDGIRPLQMKLAQQALALLLPLAARRSEYRIVRRLVDPFLQLQHPPELLTMVDSGVHEKRASVGTARNGGWNVTARNPACRSIVHQISPGSCGLQPLVPTIHRALFALGERAQ